MNRNSINCNCDLEWVVEKIRLRQMNFVGICSFPAALLGLQVNELIQPHLGGCPLWKTEPSLLFFVDLSNDLRPSQPAINLHAIVGSSLLIACSPNQTSNNTVWLKDGQKFEKIDGATLLGNGSLWIQRASTADQGLYTCDLIDKNLSNKLNLTIDGMELNCERLDCNQTWFNSIFSHQFLPHSFIFRTRWFKFKMAPN